MAYVPGVLTEEDLASAVRAMGYDVEPPERVEDPAERQQRARERDVRDLRRKLWATAALALATIVLSLPLMGTSAGGPLHDDLFMRP